MRCGRSGFLLRPFARLAVVQRANKQPYYAATHPPGASSTLIFILICELGHDSGIGERWGIAQNAALGDIAQQAALDSCAASCCRDFFRQRRQYPLDELSVFLRWLQFASLNRCSVSCSFPHGWPRLVGAVPQRFAEASSEGPCEMS
jgi:hypothetical protein